MRKSGLLVRSRPSALIFIVGKVGVEQDNTCCLDGLAESTTISFCHPHHIRKYD